MTLSLVSNGAAISHNDFDQIINVLQQPSGGQEKGKYILSGNIGTSGPLFGIVIIYIASLSRVSVPVSVSVDTADVAVSGLSVGPNTGVLTNGGFSVSGTNNTQTTSCNAGGNYTLQF